MKRFPPFEIGTKFGDWEVIEQLERKDALPARGVVLCSRVRCSCGTEKVVTNNYLRAGKSSSCGCKRGMALAMSGVTHGKSHSPIYKLWASIKHRLRSQRAYEGVSMYGPWADDFEAFEAFIISLGPKPTPQHSLDRIDPAGDYAPGNLRWADKTTQSLNRRNSMMLNVVENSLVQVGQKYDRLTVIEVFVDRRYNRNWYSAKVRCDCGTVKTVYQKQLVGGRTKSCGCYKNQNLALGPKANEVHITANGETHSMTEWSDITGMSKQVIWTRINKLGWDPVRAVTEPIDEKMITIGGVTRAMSDWAKLNGIPPAIATRRMYKGWSEVDAVTKPVRAWTRKDAPADT